MTLEKAVASDIDQLVGLRLAYLAEDKGGLNREDEARIRRDLPAYFAEHLNDDLLAFVARQGAVIVACALLLLVDKPMSPANRRMLLAILGAEFLWFMSENAIATYIGNYVIYYLQSSSSKTMILTIIGGLASVIGFAIAGIIADKIGRKWTITAGLSVTVLGLVVMCFVKPTEVVTGVNGEWSFPVLLYAVWVLKGFGMALVHNCSFPMVVELCSSKKIGRFTGFYYAASMSAQTITPILLGFIFNVTGAWVALPIYSSTLFVLACLVFTMLVKNIKAKKVKNVSGIEAIEGD